MAVRSFIWAARSSLALLILLTVLGFAAAAELVRGETAIVRSVVDGDTVVLESPINGALEVRLVGLQAPKLPLGRRGFQKWPLADQAKSALEKMVLDRKVTLLYGGRKMDRHGRILAHMERDDGLWVQGEMLRLGLARVYSFSDNRTGVGDLLTAERTARGKDRGIWANPFYRIRALSEAERHINSFQIVEGRIEDVAIVRGRGYLNFGANWRTDFTISIAPKSVRLFRKEGLNLEAMRGKTVRVRGWLKSFNGPMIEVTHPEQIEVIKR